MELEDKVISLENDLAIIKTTIKDAGMCSSSCRRPLPP